LRSRYFTDVDAGFYDCKEIDLSGVRIYDLANDLGVPSKTLVEFLGKMGYPVKSHSSTIDNNLADRLRRQAQAQNIIGTKPKKAKKVFKVKKAKRPKKKITKKKSPKKIKKKIKKKR